MNGAAVTIVGVTPPGFFGDALRGNLPDIWLPLALEQVVNGRGWVENPRLHWLYLMGRIKPGADRRTMEAQMQIELRQWLTHWSGILGPVVTAQIPRQTLHLRPGGSGIGIMRGTYSAGLELLMAISGFVLLIVCANLANLMMVRGLARRRQTSISLALGAARWRLVRQALTESVVLGLIGGSIGVGIAFAGTQALLQSVFLGANAVPISARPDLAVLSFAFGVSLVTGLIFGAAPAWSANRANPVEALRGAGRATEHTGLLAQRGLVVMQAALSLVLLAAAGLLIQSLRNLENQKFGFAADRRMAVRVDPSLAGYKADRLEALYRIIRERMMRLPGVMSVSYALYAPMSGNFWTLDVNIDGQPPQTVDGQNSTAMNRVGPDYFETIGTPILRGRPILESDTATARHVAVINEAFAHRFFPNQDPIGKHFVGEGAKLANAYEIVGIAADAKYLQPDRPAFPMYFRPRPQVTQYDNAGNMAFESRSLYMQDVVLRFAPGVGSPEEPIRRAFAEIDPNLTVIRIQSFEAATAGRLSQETLIVRLTSLFGLTALLLASIGLYGVTSFAVAQRSKEIGIRVALGADRKSVAGMVLRSAYALVAGGLAVGIPFAVAMGRIVGSRLYGLNWYDPAILGGAAVVLALCALAATIVPARRAASVDPVETLRGD
jgi:predicted permease